MKDYAYLKYRWQLIEWLRNRFPDDSRQFHKMKINQLRAIYISVMEKLTNNSGNPLN